ncbi:putative protein 2C [Pectobacterium phage My1]|uniref:Uncharacterized protein n=1 Tax=Pectobacterium phage My1 TaxID=1204539 RepID=J9QGQ3_9CAUD|nr:putative protein 2C [Pectobacterium phage My1]AFQ22190.1 putative protein 2C [Pectobacterium phage My1]
MENMTKTEMANTLAILLNMTGYEGQLQKLSIPAMQALYETLNANATAYSRVVRDARNAREELLISERRNKALEREVAKLTAQVFK